MTRTRRDKAAVKQAAGVCEFRFFKDINSKRNKLQGNKMQLFSFRGRLSFHPSVCSFGDITQKDMN